MPPKLRRVTSRPRSSAVIAAVPLGAWGRRSLSLSGPFNCVLDQGDRVPYVALQRLPLIVLHCKGTRDERGPSWA